MYAILVRAESTRVIGPFDTAQSAALFAAAVSVPSGSAVVLKLEPPESIDRDKALKRGLNMSKKFDSDIDEESLAKMASHAEYVRKVREEHKKEQDSTAAFEPGKNGKCQCLYCRLEDS